MKKTFLLAMIMLAASVSVASAADKNKKKNKKEVVAEAAAELPRSLQSKADTLSYAAGMASTMGLTDYLVQSAGIDTVFMADFKQGFMEAVSRGTDPKFAAYVTGMQIAQQAQKTILPQQKQRLESAADTMNDTIFMRGFIDGAMADTTVFDTEAANVYFRQQAEELKRIKNAAYMAENEAWLEANKQREGVVTLESGLQYKVLKEGNGSVAERDDDVTVRYEGMTIDGNIFDSSYKRTPDTTSFKPTQVIKGWTEALCMMPEGSVWELYIPANLAYGERSMSTIKPFSTLIFKVEVVKVGK